MSNDLEIFQDNAKMQLLKDTICKGSTDDEFQLFAYTCKRLGLDPFARQIYPVKRWDNNLKREVMSIQTGIDGYRLIADRTGKYAPGKESTYAYNKEGKLTSATAYVMKQTPDGKWHECAYTAHYSEYVATRKDGTPTGMWESKPNLMLSKCAEAACLRRAFPAELSGVYTKEEMEQAHVAEPKMPAATLTKPQITEIKELLGDDMDFEKELLQRLKNAFDCQSWEQVPAVQYKGILQVIQKHNEERLKKELTVEVENVAE